MMPANVGPMGAQARDVPSFRDLSSGADEKDLIKVGPLDDNVSLDANEERVIVSREGG